MNAKHTAKKKLLGYLVSGYRLNELVCACSTVCAALMRVMRQYLCLFCACHRLELSQSVIHLCDGQWLQADGLIHSQRLIPC